MMASSAFAQDTPQQALDANDVSEAVRLLISQTASNDAETAAAGLCGQAQIAVEMGEYDRALDFLKQAEEKDLKKKSGWNAVILWLKADLARHQGNKELFVGTLKDVKKSIKNGADVDESWEAVIDYLLCLETTDNSDARDYAEDAVDGFHSAKMYEEEALAHLRLADLEWQRDKQRRAFKAYDSALKAYENSKNSNANIHIAEVQFQIIGRHLELNNKKEAESRLNKTAQMVEAAGNPAELVAKLNEFKAKLGE